ncbi:hypothetical protein DPMN_014960 [Dreissena polymorpha]|uniref:Uncharacterized protein n=1 Tax=Dreissena polymorpha TaxID=45954 RepID=A0A9D4NA84_DREPO|nr:hypothetical protein DPMN_014960 [Dreissena polymorpha]
MLKSLDLSGHGIWFKDSDSSASSEQPVWIVVDSENQAQCADPPLVLPSIKHISLIDVTCSSTWLHSLFSTCLSLDHKVKCRLVRCDISSRVEGALSGSASITTDVNDTFSLYLFENTGPGLWEALHGQSIKCLSISGLNAELKNQNAELLFKSIQTLTQLETLNINMNDKADISPNLWENLNSLNINRVTLSLNDVWCGLIVNNVSKLSQALLSNHMETICIYLNAQPCMMEAMHGLPIESLSLYGSGESLHINHVSSLNKFLSSLKQLDKLSVFVNNDSPGLWEALHGVHIKRLSLNFGIGDLIVNYASALSQLLASFIQLQTLSIKVNFDTPGLWDAINGLNIKSLSLNDVGERMIDWMTDEAESMSLLFPSLSQLETLSLGLDNDFAGLWKALHGQYIKRLSLSGVSKSMDVYHAKLLSESISSLTQLETLTLHVFAYIDLQLPQSLTYFNFYCAGCLRKNYATY